jgi:hypothetical protein
MNGHGRRGRQFTLRRPEYTGENRCLPCTAVNLVLAGLATAGIATVSAPAALGFGVLAVGCIAVRGYLLPGTPTLTSRYLPARVLEWFGKHEPVNPNGEAFDVTGFLAAAGVLETDEPDLALSAAFEAALGDAVFELEDDRAVRLATGRLLDVAPDRLSFVEGDPWTVNVDESAVGRWESRAAFATDLAAARLLADRAPDWPALTDSQRGRALAAVRACLDFCPVCTGDVELGAERVSTCCQEYDVVVADCQDCGARLFESRVDPLAA